MTVSSCGTGGRKLARSIGVLAKASTDLLALLAVTRFSKLVRIFLATPLKNPAGCRLHKNCAMAIVTFPRCPPSCNRQKQQGFTLGRSFAGLDWLPSVTKRFSVYNALRVGFLPRRRK
jgi:hypothetical protein